MHRVTRPTLFVLSSTFWVIVTLSTPGFAQGDDDLDFAGVSVPGETFVFCLDRSASMGWSGNLDAMKAEIETSLLDLDPQQFFGLVAANIDGVSLSPAPLRATTANVASGIAWLQALAPDGTTCWTPGTLEALAIATQGPSPTLLLVGDGAPNCATSNDTILDVVSANSSQLPVHTFLAPQVNPGAATIDFFEDLAASNSGEFFDLGQALPLPYIRGDANSDGLVNIADGVTILLAGFGQVGTQCQRAHDVNGDGVVTAVADAVWLFSFIFQGGPPPPGPFPGCGTSVGAIVDCDTPLPCP